jgi:hypothetical protein
VGGSVSGGQTAMMIVWVILAVSAVGGAFAYAVVRRRRERRP